MKLPERRLQLRAPAKINWTLEVLGRRADGFHEIDTLMQTISLCDELLLEARRRERCDIVCGNPKVPTDDSNLIASAWRLMRREFPERVGGMRVRLIKCIPMGAGLGGGSSDAAAMLVGMNRLWGLRLSKKRLAELAAEIGSDIPYFIYGGVARARGRGEIIAPLVSKLRAIPMVVVYPGFPSPTAEAYRKLRAPKFGGKSPRVTRTSRAAKAVTEGNLAELLKVQINEFDTALAGGDRRYLLLKRRMLTAGLDRVMMSGSGSACYGIAKDVPSARLAAETLRDYYRDVFACVTKASGV